MTPRESSPPDPLDELGDALLAAALLLGAPAAATATTLAWLIDRQGWRRWPALLAGTAATMIVATLGAWAAARHALTLLASRRHAAPLAATDLAWIGGLQAAIGIAAAPLLLLVTQHRDEHETTLHHRRMSRRRRFAVQADRFVTRPGWPTPPDRTVLGVRLDGAVTGCTTRYRTRALVAVPLAEWGRQALIVGETGSGKTVTALTVASEAMRVGWDVYWIDGKADPDVADRFLTLARRHGLDPADGSQAPIDGWRGSGESIVNRLLATQRFTEPYYAGIARNVLKWAVARPGPPRSFAELVARMDQRALRRAWRETPDEADKIRAMAATDFLGARYRYEGVAWAVGATLDGDWSYEDVRAAYVPVGRPEHRDQAEEVGAFLLEDLLHWAMARKPPSRRALVVVDEFSKLASRPDAAVELVERVRSFGVGIVLIGQTWASLGRTESVRDRLAGTVGTVVVHQLKQPDRLVELAGRTWGMQRTEQLWGRTPTGRATQRAGYRPVVEPDDVRALRTGEAFVIRGGEAVKVRIRARAPAPGPDHAIRGRPSRRYHAHQRAAVPPHLPSGRSSAASGVRPGGRDQRWDVRAMPMREDCRHFESRTYDSGDVARYCTLGLAPEQPWRCPEHCDKYEPSLIEGGMVTGSLARPPVEAEPDDDPEEIAAVLEDAEAIVEGAEHDVVVDLDRQHGERKRFRFWRRRPPDDGDDFQLSNR